jgi:hypothetical protein
LWTSRGEIAGGVPPSEGAESPSAPGSPSDGGSSHPARSARRWGLAAPSLPGRGASRRGGAPCHGRSRRRSWRGARAAHPSPAWTTAGSPTETPCARSRRAG